MIDLDAGWLLRLAQVSRRAALTEWVVQGSCIATTRVVVRAARYFGVNATALPLRVDWVSPAFVASQGRDGHVVGINGTGRFDPAHNSWDGHLGAVFGTREAAWLVDASADMFCRPGKLLIVEPTVAPLTGWPALHVNEHGALGHYEPIAGCRSWRTSPDWRGNSRAASRAIALAIEAMKEELCPR